MNKSLTILRIERIEGVILLVRGERVILDTGSRETVWRINQSAKPGN